MKVSLLVPVYGVEQFIEACAVSLFEQTYAMIEYIFVDDCSPDDSIGILQRVMNRYPLRQPSVRIVQHEHNRGLGAARATALSAATGDYVMAVDSDDLLPTDAVEKLCQAQQQTGADIVDGTYGRYRDGQVFARVQPFQGSKEAMLKLILIQNTIPHNLWGRLVRRQLFIDNQINSIEGINMAEDYAVTPRLLFCGTHASIMDDVYYYRDNATSTFYEDITPRHVHSYIKANAVVQQFFKQHDASHVYQYPREVGMLKVYALSKKAGIRRSEVDDTCQFSPSSFYVRCCRACFSGLPRMMYLSYLAAKWFYKRKFSNVITPF